MARKAISKSPVGGIVGGAWWNRCKSNAVNSVNCPTRRSSPVNNNNTTPVRYPVNNVVPQARPNSRTSAQKSPIDLALANLLRMRVGSREWDQAFAKLNALRKAQQKKINTQINTHMANADQMALQGNAAFDIMNNGLNKSQASQSQVQQVMRKYTGGGLCQSKYR